MENLYYLLLLAVVIAGYFLIKYLKGKGIVDNKDLELISQLLGVSAELIKQTELADPEVIKITQIVSGLIRSAEFEGKKADYDYLYEATIKLMDKEKIEVTPERVAMIDYFISLVLRA